MSSGEYITVLASFPYRVCSFQLSIVPKIPSKLKAKLLYLARHRRAIRARRARTTREASYTRMEVPGVPRRAKVALRFFFQLFQQLFIPVSRS